MNRNSNKKSEKIIQNNLQQNNDESIDILLQDVQQLKQISIDFNGDIGNERKTTEKVSKHFDDSSKLLDKTLKQVENLLKSKTNKISCYLIMGTVVFFVFLYIYQKKI